MFNLEQSIAEWRQQMLAAGIKTPVPLEELESHLREEVERRARSGMNRQQALEMTISQIGPGAELRTEFAKDKSLLDLLFGDDKFTRTNRIMAMLWLINCWQHVASISRINWWQDFNYYGFNFSSLLSPHLYYYEQGILVYAFAIFIYGVGALGSALAFLWFKCRAQLSQADCRFWHHGVHYEQDRRQLLAFNLGLHPV